MSDNNIDNVKIGEQFGAEDPFRGTDCTPEEHAGRPSVVLALGPNDEHVRMCKLCTECNLVHEEVVYDEAHAIELQGPGGTYGRWHNYPGDERLEKAHVSEVVDAPVEDINGVGMNEKGELLFSVADRAPDDKSLKEYADD